MKNPNDVGGMERKAAADLSGRERLFSALGEIDEAYIADADPEIWREKAEQKKKSRFRIVMIHVSQVAAACLVLMVGLSVWHIHNTNDGTAYFDDPKPVSSEKEAQETTRSEEAVQPEDTNPAFVQPEDSNPAFVQPEPTYPAAAQPDYVDNAYAEEEPVFSDPEGTPVPPVEAADDTPHNPYGAFPFWEGIGGRDTRNEEQEPEAEGGKPAGVKDNLAERVEEEASETELWADRLPFSGDLLSEAEEAAGFSLDWETETDPSWTVSYRAGKGILCAIWRDADDRPVLILTKTANAMPDPSYDAETVEIWREGGYQMMRETF